MKIVCHCGEEVKFIKHEDWDDENDDSDDSTNVSADSYKIEVCAEHDEVWIRCNTCGSVAHFFA